MSTNHTRTSFSSDDSENISQEPDNLHREEQENSANGLDSTEVTGGQNGRNVRGMGSQDMDSANGLLRLNDTDDGAMDVPDEAIANAAASEGQTKTSPVGAANYVPAPAVAVPNAQQATKKQDEADQETKPGNSDSNTDEAVTQEEKEEDIAQTGTSVDHQPAY